MNKKRDVLKYRGLLIACFVLLALIQGDTVTGTFTFGDAGGDFTFRKQ